MGARPLHIFSLLVLEAVSLTLAGIALGLALLYAGIAAAKPWLEQQYGLFLPLAWPTPSELTLLGGILAASLECLSTGAAGRPVDSPVSDRRDYQCA